MGQTQSQQVALRNVKYENSIEVTINGKIYKVSNDTPGDTNLVTFIREHAHLKGTKFMCLEGGCGACVVSVQSTHPATGQIRSYSVNSCLIPIFACHGWSITTVEGLGSEASGYHNIQKRLAAASGTQCGYCSPGMIMNMYSLLENISEVTMKEVENSFSGNICRCTGYRPILDAFKSFAKDAPSELVNKLLEIEDSCFPSKTRCDGMACGNKCSTIFCPPLLARRRVFLNLENGQTWYRPTSVKEIFEVLDMIGESTYRFICGHTGRGVYRVVELPEMLIDLNGVAELFSCSVSENGINLGGNVSLEEAKDILQKAASDHPDLYSYCSAITDHFDQIANIPVRNVGSIAGNLSLKHQRHEFPSDVFLLLEAVGASITLDCASGVSESIGLEEFLSTNMDRKIILKITLPPLDASTYIFRAYKIMPRAQNAHAYVNAGFLFNLDKANGFKVMSKPRIVYGGINPLFVHATRTEEVLSGKPLLTADTLKSALETLDDEIQPDDVPSDASSDYRKGLALSLFYKFILSVDPDAVSEEYRSGGRSLERPLSRGSQEFDSDTALWPLNKPVPKLEGLMQCSGEAEYINDQPNMKDEVWAQLVLCDRAVGYIKNIDPSEALKIPGVVGFFCAEDIPGENCFLRVPGDIQDKIFAQGQTDYAGQAVGVIVAESPAVALRAVTKVQINYSKIDAPVLTLSEVVDKKMIDRIKEFAKMSRKKKKNDVKFRINGRWELKGQYHFMMETLTCVVVPKETHLDVFSSTQHPASVQEAICKALNIPAHRVNINVRRIGGGYGAKLDRANHTSAVCALAAHLLHRPVRMVLNLENNMEWMGKRVPNLCDYKVGVNDSGQIQYLDADIFQDNGIAPSPFIAVHSLKHAGNGYDTSTHSITMYGVSTNNAWNTWCRAPGSTEHISMMENIMEHIAKTINKTPIAVRLANLPKGSALPKMIDDLLETAQYTDRLKHVEDFNMKNRWKKRGLNVSTMTYPFNYRAHFHAQVSIFAVDGTVAISHGGVEMGQGINTKAVQVAAKFLGVDMKMVVVNPLVVSECPNNSRTGGCQGTDSVCYAVMMCCQELNRRLAPYKAKLGKSADWKSVIKAADAARVNLHHSYMFTPKDHVKPFDICGVVATEVEIDVLTGQFQISRVDLLEDAGQCVSPEVDIGQIEGSFVMGLGYYTSEELLYNKETGALISNRTWNYKPPGAKDIPADFRIILRKNAFNPNGVLGSKATGEPAFCLSCSVVFALRNAIMSARRDAGLNETWLELSVFKPSITSMSFKTLGPDMINITRDNTIGIAGVLFFPILPSGGSRFMAANGQLLHPMRSLDDPSTWESSLDAFTYAL